jgi:hypothetical protein
MKHAKNLTFGDTFEGMQFAYFAHTMSAGLVTIVGTVTGKRLTKTGRVHLTVDSQKWSNGPCSPTSLLQE